MGQALNYFQLLAGGSDKPCYFVDVETYELLYFNEAMALLCNGGNIGGNHCCYEVLYDKSEPCHHCPMKELAENECQENLRYHENMEISFLVQSTLLEYQNKYVSFHKHVATENQVREGMCFDDAMAECAVILSDHNSQKMLENFLSLLGRYYICDKTYVYTLDEEQKSLENSVIWRSSLSKMPKEDWFSLEAVGQLVKWLEARSPFEVLELDGDSCVKDFGEEGASNFDYYDIEKLVICPLYGENDVPVGFIGMSNREGAVKGYRLLKAVARFVQDSFHKNNISEELCLLTDRDALTGFYNRYKYAEFVQKLQQNPPEKMGVVFVNLNGLKKTNEYFGFDIGDQQILKATQLLKEFFENDFFRVSGDEFLAFYDGVEEEEFRLLVDRAHLHLQETENKAFSLGHAWSRGAVDIVKLVATADTVMYINKQEYYFDHLKEGKDVQDSLLQDLFLALEKEEFQVYLQPKVDLVTGEVVGAEALVRRVDSVTGKMMFPDQFVPIYEKKSIIRHIDLFVLRRVCQILAQWKEFQNQFAVSVNLSRVTLLEHNIVDTFASICDEYFISHEKIVVEVTERVGLVENDVASHLVEEFRAQKFKISLDDFGCAYSNIVTLVQIKVDEVKIDKSLVEHILTNQKNHIIVKNMIHMISALENSTALAEGIEVQEQAKLLLEFGCRYGQGYFYSPPIPHEVFFDQYVGGTVKNILVEK